MRSSATDQLQIASNLFAGISSPVNSNLSYWTTPFFNDQEMGFRVDVLPNATFGVSALLRIQDPGTSDVDYYQWTYTVGTGWRMFVVTNDGYTLIAGPFASPVLPAFGGLGFRVVGSTLSGYAYIPSSGWSLISQITDTTLTNPGFIGIEAVDTSGRVSNVFGGAVPIHPVNGAVSDFHQADGAPVGFAQAISTYSMPNVVSNQLDWTQFPSLYWTQRMFKPNQEAWLKPTGTYTSYTFILRLQNPNTGHETCYLVRGNPQDPLGWAEAYVVPNGMASSTNLGYSNFIFEPTDIWMWATIEGSLISLYGSGDGELWALRNTWTDGTISGPGYIGLMDLNAGGGATEFIGLFGGGSIDGAPSPVPPHWGGKGAV